MFPVEANTVNVDLPSQNLMKLKQKSTIMLQYYRQVYERRRKYRAISESHTKEQRKRKQTTQSGRETKNGDGENVVKEKKVERKQNIEYHVTIVDET